MDLIFQGQTLQTLIFPKWREHKNALYDSYGGQYSPPGGITTNVVLGDLDLKFQGQTFEKN